MVYALLFAVIHWHTRMNTAFQVHFMVLVALCMTKVVLNYRKCDDAVAKVVYSHNIRILDRFVVALCPTLTSNPVHVVATISASA